MIMSNRLVNQLVQNQLIDCIRFPYLLCDKFHAISFLFYPWMDIEVHGHCDGGVSQEFADGLGVGPVR